MKSNIPLDIKATIISVLADEACLMMALLHLFHPEVSDDISAKLEVRGLKAGTCTNFQFAQVVAEVLKVLYPVDATQEDLCKYIIKHILRGVING